MKTPVIKILATGELLDPKYCTIYTCSTLSYTNCDSWNASDWEHIYNSTEWEWSEQDLDIFHNLTYQEWLHYESLQLEIDRLMADFDYKTSEEYDTRRQELEIEFGLNKLINK